MPGSIVGVNRGNKISKKSNIYLKLTMARENRRTEFNISSMTASNNLGRRVGSMRRRLGQGLSLNTNYIPLEPLLRVALRKNCCTFERVGGLSKKVVESFYISERALTNLQKHMPMILERMDVTLSLAHSSQEWLTPKKQKSGEAPSQLLNRTSAPFQLLSRTSAPFQLINRTSAPFKLINRTSAPFQLRNRTS
ncbi:unnamed protein product, partial [Owenia fusiformis]